MLTMSNLESDINHAKEYGYEFIGVKIQMEGFEEPETIINPRENFDAKLNYYKKAYNDDLTLKAFNGIRIIGFTYGNDFMEIEEDLMS